MQDEEERTECGTGEQSDVVARPEGRTGEGEEADPGATPRDRQKSREDPMGCVYFIETWDSAFVKIGFSTDVPGRFKTIGVLLPDLRLLGHIPGTLATERWLHRKFAQERNNGEWFQQTERLKQFIQNLGVIEPAKPTVKIPTEPPVKTPTAESPIEPPCERPECPEPGVVQLPSAITDFFREQGKRGGELSGKARMQKLTPEQRQAVAKKAAAASAKVRAAKAAKKK